MRPITARSEWVPDERARLPLPFKGLLKMLKHVAVQRAGFRPWTRVA